MKFLYFAFVYQFTVVHIFHVGSSILRITIINVKLDEGKHLYNLQVGTRCNLLLQGLPIYFQLKDCPSIGKYAFLSVLTSDQCLQLREGINFPNNQGDDKTVSLSLSLPQHI